MKRIKSRIEEIKNLIDLAIIEKSLILWIDLKFITIQRMTPSSISQLSSIYVIICNINNTKMTMKIIIMAIIIIVERRWLVCLLQVKEGKSLPLLSSL